MKEYKIINPKQYPQRAFYRVYVLPRHIDVSKNAGNTQRAKLLDAEMKEHLEWIKENGHDKQLKAYINDQQTRQDAYDKIAKLKGELSVLRGTDMNRLDVKELTAHAKDLERVAVEVEKAEAAFEAAKENFAKNWQTKPSAAVSKGKG